jgi:hypothetical protein
MEFSGEKGLEDCNEEEEQNGILWHVRKVKCVMGIEMEIVITFTSLCNRN